jgi:hypothetical protein
MVGKMHFVTIPFDYKELPEPDRAAVIPICIPRNDRVGTPIAWGWFEAATRLSDRMLALARRYLRNTWRVSEFFQVAVHRVWRPHGEDLGRRPEGRLFAHAAWHAKYLRIPRILMDRIFSKAGPENNPFIS